jgi:hypothetical protein
MTETTRRPRDLDWSDVEADAQQMEAAQPAAETLDRVTDQLLRDVAYEAEQVSRRLGKIAREIAEAQQRMTDGALPTYSMSDDLLGSDAAELTSRIARLRYVTQLAGHLCEADQIQAAYQAGLGRDSYR